MRPTLWKKVLAQGLTLAVVTQAVAPAFADHNHFHPSSPKKIERSIFGPKVYVRGTGKSTVYHDVLSVPSDVKGPYTLKIAQEGRVMATVRVNGWTAVSNGDFKHQGPKFEERIWLKRKHANTLDVTMEGPAGPRFTLEVTGRAKSEPPPPPPPQISILAPTAGAWVGSTTTARVTFQAPGGLASLTTLLDGSAAPLVVSSATAQGPLTLSTEGPHQFTATISDTSGQTANSSVSFQADLTPPSLMAEWPTEGAVVKTSSASFGGAVTDLLSGLSSVACGGTPATVLYGRWQCDVALSPGANSVTISARDMVGNVAQMTRTLTYQPNRPPTAQPGGPYGGEQGTTINFNGTGSTDPDGDPLTYSWDFGGGSTATGATTTHIFTSTGTYPVTLRVSDGELTGEATTHVTVVLTPPPPPPPPPPDPTLPPDPVTVAPPLDLTVATNMATSTEFLYTGDHPIQVGVSSGTINPAHVAVLRGKIINREGAALPGASVTVLAHPEFGSTKSRADGMFDLAVNGGGFLTLTYEKDGYLTVQRQVNAPWQDWAVVDDAVMIPLDPQVTPVNLSAATIQVARGTVVTDESGQRQATLIFPAGATAEKVNPDGTTEPLTTMHVRATEYTVGPKGPQSMPGELPPTSGYTYAVELSADEALNAKTVTFNKPMSFYVDNFLHFPVGGIVPVGYYDRERGVWVPSPNGKIVKILAPTGDLAEIDTDGSGAPATPEILSNLGVTDDERRQLAKLYTPGQSLWRVPITHMTPWDCNWPYGPPEGAKGPTPDQDPFTEKKEDDPCRQAGGSVVDCENQTVSESVGIAGTPFTLNYISDRVPGYQATSALNIPVSGADMPPGVKRMDVDITVAGVTTRQSYTPESAKKNVFKWNGKDAYGRAVNSNQKADVRIQYTYDATYREPAAVTSSFGLAGDTVISGDRTRAEVSLSRQSSVDLDSWNAQHEGLGGWTLNAHHQYNPENKTLLLGDGSRRTASGVIKLISTALEANFIWGLAVDASGDLFFSDGYEDRIQNMSAEGIVTTIAGSWRDDGTNGDGGPATEASLSNPGSIALDERGNLYFIESDSLYQKSARVRKISTDGIITTVAGNGELGFSGDGGPATEAQLDPGAGNIAVDRSGNIFIADNNNHRIRKVSSDGIITTVAGVGPVFVGPDGDSYGGYSGDGGPATKAQFYFPGSVAVDASGNLFIADSYNYRIRKVSPDGIITTIAGNGEFGFSGDGGPATEAQIKWPEALTLDVLGNLYFSDGLRVRKVAIDGIISTVAGRGVYGSKADGGPAIDATLGSVGPIAVDPLGALYLTEYRSDEHSGIRKVQADSSGFGSDENVIPSEDGTELYVFDVIGRHLRTVGAKTKAVIQQFAYNTRGELMSVADGDGNVTTIERDAAGKPIAIVAPHGQRTELTLDANGWLSKITNPAGGAHQANYSENGLMQSFTDPNNNKSTMEYDDLGRLVYDKSPNGKTWSISRGEFTKGKEIGLTTALGRTMKYKVQDLPTGDHLRTNTTADGKVTESIRKTDGTTIVTSPTGVNSSVKKGPDPRLGMAAPLPSNKQTMPSGLTRETNITRTVNLSNPDDPLSLTAETTTVTLNGQPYTTVYSSATRTISSLTPTGRQSVALLDTRGRIAQSQSGTLAPAQYAYDTQGRLSELTQGTGPESRSALFSYGTDGYLKTVTDALGRQVNFEHDVLGRVTKQTLPDGRETKTTYDAVGNVTSITPPGRPAHVYSYDAGNQVSGYTPPDLGAGPTATTYTYDKESHPTLITRPDGQTMTFDYNAGGQLSTVTTPSGTYNYTYDSAGRLSNLSESAGVTLTYAYDGTLPLSTTWTGPVTGDVSRTYDNNFRVVSQSVNGGNTIDYAYDNDGLLTKAGDMNLSRDADNGLLTATDLNVVTDAWTYNQFGEPTNYTAKTSGADAYSVTYTRDALGRITEKNETMGATSHLYVYTYDASGRLTNVQKDGTTTATYTYDTNGNRTKKVASGVTTNGTYDNQDRLLTYGANSYTYTDNGELKTKADATGTTTYTYDVAGNLRTVALPSGTIIDYVIDGQNRRIGKKVNGALTQGFLYNNQLQIVAELDGTGAVVSRFVYADRANVPSFMVKGGTTYRIISDHLGCPRLVVNATDGNVAQKLDYDEFGNVLNDTNPGFIPFAFAGGLYDQDTKLARFGARDYDPENGRWTEKDPVRFQAGEMNLYGYAMNDPINLTDPSGLYSWMDLLYDTSNLSAGFGDTLTSGFGLFDTSLTEMAREALGANGVVDPCSGFYTAGEIGAYAWLAIMLRQGVQPGGWMNSNRYLRMGFGRNGGNQVFRIAGEVFEGLTGQGHFDIWKGGPL